MPDLLLELFSEEIPARMQAQAAKDLERLVVGALSDRGLLFEAVRSFAGPRRLTLAITGLPVKQPDVKEERKGPRVGAPQKALDGFLRSAGVTLEQCEKQSDAKGEFYVAVIDRKGRNTADVIGEIVPDAMAKFPWPKSMRWGAKVPSQAIGAYGTLPYGVDPSELIAQFGGAELRWVRPLHGVLATFDGEVVPFRIALIKDTQSKVIKEIKSGNQTFGHRFLSDGKPIAVRRFDDYEAALKAAHVVLDADERKQIIAHEAKQKAFALGLELIEDEGLLNEVAGLAEWPVVLVGTIEDQFMDVPPEILQTAMRTHQKYFALQHPHPEEARSAVSKDEGGKMANKFALVANMEAADGGKQIVAGNERVLRARLSDAKFFWDQDRKTKLETRVDALKNIVFHAKLGTQYERVERITALAGEIAEKIGADVEKAKRAAWLCKADLTTGVVGEFPELQGVMGRYYALHDDEYAEVADAIRDHYKPVGPSDAVPTNKISIAVALADKLDQLVGFFAVDEKPTGSSDPYALRRAALGYIRVQLAAGLNIPLRDLFRRHIGEIGEISLRDVPTADHDSYAKLSTGQKLRALEDALFDEVLGFLADRLKIALREKGTRHDLIDAVFSLGNEDDLVRLVARVEALQSFLKTEDGANLLAAYKRAANILKAEEKKDKTTFDGEPDAALLSLPQEKALATALADANAQIRKHVEAEKFVEAMGVMASLRPPVDAFFDAVKVNDDNADVRVNRLNLLARLRATLHLVADFSKIEG